MNAPARELWQKLTHALIKRRDNARAQQRMKQRQRLVEEASQYHKE